MTKLIGAGIILIASTQIGLSFANKLKRRMEEVRVLKLAFNAIEGEMTFTRLPLGDILEKISLNMPKNLGRIFLQTGQEIKKKSGRTTAEIFNEKVMEGQNNLHLKQEDLSQIKEFISLLGKSDLDNSLKSIKLAQSALEEMEANAKENYEKNGKLYLTLGVCAGLVITILMI